MNVATTVQVEVAVKVATQVPPVPGNVPPLKVKGAVNAFAVIAVAENPPVFVIVNVLSVADPTA